MLEFILERESALLRKDDPERGAEGQPLLGFCHGSPGTGKSLPSKWICRMFTEALGLKHEDVILCVAFTNRVAQAIGREHDACRRGHCSRRPAEPVTYRSRCAVYAEQVHAFGGSR